jgi:hypothetical protein
MAEDYAREFMRVLREHSYNKDDPISEWTLNDNPQISEGSRCICKMVIREVWTIYNSKTNQVLEIGCDCAKRWLEPSMTCKDCGRVLGQVMKRKKQKNFYCGSCNRKNNKARKERIELLSGLYYKNCRLRDYKFEDLTDEEFTYLWNNLDDKWWNDRVLKEYLELVYVIEDY